MPARPSEKAALINLLPARTDGAPAGAGTCGRDAGSRRGDQRTRLSRVEGLNGRRRREPEEAREPLARRAPPGRSLTWRGGQPVSQEHCFRLRGLGAFGTNYNQRIRSGPWTAATWGTLFIYFLVFVFNLFLKIFIVERIADVPLFSPSIAALHPAPAPPHAFATLLSVATGNAHKHLGSMFNLFPPHPRPLRLIRLFHFLPLILLYSPVHSVY